MHYLADDEARGMYFMWGDEVVWNPRQIRMDDFLTLGRLREEDWIHNELERLNEYVRGAMAKGDITLIMTQERMNKPFVMAAYDKIQLTAPAAEVRPREADERRDQRIEDETREKENIDKAKRAVTRGMHSLMRQ